MAPSPETRDYCCHQRSSAAQVISEIEAAMGKAEKERRILFIHLLNEILMQSDMANTEFIEHIGKRIRHIIGEFARTAFDPSHLKTIMALLGSWASKGIYVPKFAERIRKEILEPAYNRLLTEADPQRDKQSQRYTKAFLADFRLLQEQPWSAAAYSASQRWHEFDTHISRFNSEFNNLDLTDQDSQLTRRRVDDMLSFAYQYKAQLLDLITMQAQVHRDLERAC